MRDKSDKIVLFKRYREQTIRHARATIERDRASREEDTIIYESGLPVDVFVEQYLNWLETLEEAKKDENK